MRVGDGFEISKNAGARKLQVLPLVLTEDLFGGLGAALSFFLRSPFLVTFQKFDLRFYVFAFPPAGHGHIFA